MTSEPAISIRVIAWGRAKPQNIGLSASVGSVKILQMKIKQTFEHRDRMGNSFESFNQERTVSLLNNVSQMLISFGIKFLRELEVKEGNSLSMSRI